MIVRAVEIDQEIAEVLEDGEGGGGGVDGLPVGADGAELPLQNQRPLLAGIHAVFLEALVDGRGIVELKECFDGAGIGAGADDGFIGALAQEELEGPDDDGFAGPGLAGDGGEPGTEGPLEVLDKGEIANAEGGEHCGHAGIMQTWRSFFKPMRAMFHRKFSILDFRISISAPHAGAEQSSAIVFDGGEIAGKRRPAMPLIEIRNSKFENQCRSLENEPLGEEAEWDCR